MRTHLPTLVMMALVGSGQRAGAVPGIDPAAQRGRRGHKTEDKRCAIGPLRSVQSFFYGMGCNSPIRQ
jgi:hypothetical protein